MCGLVDARMAGLMDGCMDQSVEGQLQDGLINGCTGESVNW